MYLTTKTLLVMRLATILLLGALLQAKAEGKAQTVTLSEKNAPLEKIFDRLRAQTGYLFFYNDQLMKKARPVTIRLRNATVTEALDRCFEGQPLTYTVMGKQIIVRQKEEPPVAKPDTAAPLRIRVVFPLVAGYVVDESNRPLEGVSVILKSSGRGAQTDRAGIFQLKMVDPSDVLLVTAIGYNKDTVPLNGNQMAMIVMHRATNELDKVVVQAYGTTSRRLSTGSIVKVTAEDIEKQPVTNPLLALQGRVAGLVVTPANGYAASPVKLQIRGRNSIDPSYPSDPLFVIDGIPMVYSELSPISGYAGGSSGVTQGFTAALSPTQGQSPFFNMNPLDIESIEVLKDADATSIYGARGANGVIIITTKKGKPGPAHLSVRASQGISEINRYWHMLNTTQYLQMRREALRNDGFIPNAQNAPDLIAWDTTRSVDWQHALWGGVGRSTDLMLELSGGSEETTYRISGNYERTTDILTTSGSIQKAGGMFALTTHSRDQKLLVNVSTGFTYSNVNTIAVPQAGTLAPDAPPIFDKGGNLNYAEWNEAPGAYFPFANLLTPYTSATYMFSSSADASYELYKGLKVSVSAGFSNSQNNQVTLSPIAALNPLYNPTGSNLSGNTQITDLNIEPQLLWSGGLWGGHLGVQAGVSHETGRTTAVSSYALGFTSDQFLQSMANAPIITVSNGLGVAKSASIFGRINYSWGNKYVVNLNGRKEGSSRFGPGRQYGNFGSGGVAWILSEEHWLKLPSYIPFLKLKGNYGTEGSDNVHDYEYLSQWGVGNNPLPTYQGIPPLTNLHAVNQDYHWATKKSFDGGLEVHLLKNDCLSLEADYYLNRMGDQLTNYPTAVFTGFSSVTANWPALVQNRGLEFIVRAKPVVTKDFTWVVGGNISFNRNILKSYPGIASSPYASQYKVGDPLNTRYVLKYAGVDPQTGQYSYVDYNHDGQVRYNTAVVPGTMGDDRYLPVDMDPKYFGGIENIFTYKQWYFSFNFDYRHQLGTNALASYLVSPGSLDENVATTVFNDHWQKPGDHATYARFTTAGGQGDVNFLYSDGALTDASFIRLTNLALSYSLAPKWLSRVKLQGCTLSLMAQNLFVITRYKGIDPETQTFGGMPQSRSITGNLSINL